MTLDIFKEKGTPLDRQRFTWRELVQAPTSKLDDDAFTRVRIILMNGLESDALRFSHATARMMNGDMRLPLEKWLLHEAMEVYNYMGCMQYETNPRVKEIWERFV